MRTAEEQSFLDLLDEHQGILHRVCRLYAPLEEERRDLFQDMVAQLWRAWPGFRRESKVTTWMYQIALNTAISTLRQAKRRIPGINWSDALAQLPHPDPDNLYTEELPRLYLAIAQLNDVEKAITLLYLDDLSYDEIAAVTGITAGNARVKMNRIREKLRVMLQSDQL
ncbi:MAG: sigma-70 family RNA polymerase sigma factor [Saprospiraceae bacterium]